MESEPDSAHKIAAATVLAAEDYLRSLTRDHALTFTYWTLVRLMSAARGDDFTGELRRLGLPESGDTTGIEFFAAVAEHVREGIEAQHAGSAAGELAALALRRALTETVATQSVGLFGATTDDLRLAFRAYSTPRQFGDVSQRFFGDFLSRVLRSALDREAPHVLRGVDETTGVLRDIDIHARQSAAILRDFSGDWLSKRGYETAGDISLEDARGFIAVALRKLRSELKREGEL